MGDLGVRATESIIEDLQRKVKEQHIKEPAECKELLIESIKEQMKVEETAYRFENAVSAIDENTGRKVSVVLSGKR